MRALVSAGEMREAEHEAATRGLSLTALMQLAARGAAQTLLASRQPGADRYLIFAGPGNNGGDALVVAGLLRDAGVSVHIVTFRRPSSSPVDPPGIPRFDLADDADGARLRAALHSCDVVVDGILGIGKARPIGADLARLLATINGAPRGIKRVALDVPTGIDADNGQTDDAAFQADDTYTFGYMKRGLLLHPARAMAGSIHLIDVGLPLVPRVPVTTWAPDDCDVAGWLPKRLATAHKFSVGSVLALAGSPRFVGAPILCTAAAFRAGAGYVTLAAQQETLHVLAARLLETTMHPLPADAGAATSEFQDTARRYSALLVGPGLGRSEATQALIRQVLNATLTGPKAAVVDADALYALSHVSDWWANVSLPLVLTPHSGEMARLTGMDTGGIEADRLAVAVKFARLWRQVVVLKGAPTIVASPEGEISINQTGNALLATAGTGDVLSGVIAALLAGGSSPYDAARAGVHIHGKAADIATDRFGDRGMVAGDLLELLPEAIKEVLKVAAR